MTNLIIDIGNTVAKLAAFEGEELKEVDYTDNRTLEGLPAFCRRHAFGQGILSTVVSLTEEAESRLLALPFPVKRLGVDTPLPIRLCYRTPHTLGPDRIAAVVGAQAAQPGRDVLVIDAGTCITYELLDAEGCYHGGNISPGVEMRLKALHEHTSRLPLVEAEGELPEVGQDTETAIRAGVLKGVAYEIEGYATELKHKYPQLLIFLTGGCRFSFATKLKNAIFADKFLVLKGLNRILIYNNEKN